jgi:hypothetical protein
MIIIMYVLMALQRALIPEPPATHIAEIPTLTGVPAFMFLQIALFAE